MKRSDYLCDERRIGRQRLRGHGRVVEQHATSCLQVYHSARDDVQQRRLASACTQHILDDSRRHREAVFEHRMVLTHLR